MYEFTFEKLDVWRKSRTLVKEIYVLLKDFPPCERYALADQLRRSAISIPSNIAEGSGRPSIKERIRFTEIAYGSLMEAYNQLILAADLGYINATRIKDLKPDFEEVAKMLSGFHRSLLSQTQQPR